jgi:phasin family protein
MADAKTVKDTVHAAQTATDQISTAGAQALKDGVEKSLAKLNELNAQSKQNIEALMAAATATAKGAEALGAQALAYSKSAVENHVEVSKALSSARSVQELVELQSAYAKSAMEAYMAEMNRASETFTATFKEALRPLNERATAVVETLKTVR